ncbi:MAG: hypothetical protein AAGA77_24690 [Bacteroidota bacterium]
MTRSLRSLPHLFWVSIPFILLFAIILFTRSQAFLGQSSSLSLPLVLDLLGTFPLIYFLIIRKTRIPNVTVIPMIILGMLVGYAVLPEDQHYPLDVFKDFILPILELFILSFVLFKVYGAVKLYKSKKTSGVDFYDVLKETCHEIVPERLADLLISEISVIYYGFFNWKSPVLSENEFSYHKRSGSPSLFGALIFIVMVETIAVHVVLMKWSPLAALILSILSVYTGLQLLGFGRSLSKRPIYIEGDKLILRYGMMNESTIAICDIESVELSRKALKYDDEVRKFSILGDLESHNVVIKCKRPQQMRGIYGMNRSFRTLALHVDEKERFAVKLTFEIN